MIHKEIINSSSSNNKRRLLMSNLQTKEITVNTITRHTPFLELLTFFYISLSRPALPSDY